jgi:hypothetical protein
MSHEAAEARQCEREHDHELLQETVRGSMHAQGGCRGATS